MNNNRFINIKDDDIGIDPTVMQKVDSLDVIPSNNRNKKKLEKGNNNSSIIKKILFTIVVLALMAVVAYGVYYYLSLGRKTSKAVVLENQEIYVGQSLPSSILEYGDFSKVDISKCTLDVLDVNTNEVGTYNYSVMCGEVKYSAKVTVIEKKVFNLATKIVYKNINENITAEEFIESEEGYTYSLVDDKSDYEIGLHPIKIKVRNIEGQETEVTGLLYVLEKSPDFYLTCDSNEITEDIYATKIIDRFVFDDFGSGIGNMVRRYRFTYRDEMDYERTKNKIKDGKISLDGKSGYVLIDNVNFNIDVINLKSLEEINTEYNSTLENAYRQINNYYRRTLKYSCSI